MRRFGPLSNGSSNVESELRKSRVWFLFKHKTNERVKTCYLRVGTEMGEGICEKKKKNARGRKVFQATRFQRALVAYFSDLSENSSS